MRQGRLYRHILHTLDFDEHPATDEWKLCVATHDRQRVLRECHDDPTAGHLGIAETLTRLCRLYYWPGMLREGARHVRTCESCQKYKASQQAPAGRMHATPVDRPWEMISADLVRPLPRSSAGNTTLRVIQDRVTKWIEIRALRKATGPAITRAIRELVILRHGCPDVLVTDNGRQFVGKELGKALKEWGVVKTMLSQYIGRSQRTWDEYCPEVAFAYNTAQHSAMGYSPAYLNTGRELVPPGSLRYENGQRRATGLQERLRQRTHILSDKAAYRNAKLAEKYSGPFKVQRKISPVIFDLLDKRNRTVQHVHVRDLKPYEPAPTPIDGAAEGTAEERGYKRSSRQAARRVGTAATAMSARQPVSEQELNRWPLRLDPDTGAVRHVGEPRRIGSKKQNHRDDSYIDIELLKTVSNSKVQISTWEEFTADFLMVYAGHKTPVQRAREARARVQKPGEPFHEYMNALTTLMRRALIPTDKYLETIYENMLPDYTAIIGPESISSIRDLLRQVQRIERAMERKNQMQRTASRPLAAATNENRDHTPSQHRTEPIEKRLPEILLAMWSRRNTHEGVSSTGKRRTGLVANGRTPAPDIKYTPRPFLPIRILGREIDALLDTGAQLSCINAEAYEWALEQGMRASEPSTRISLADGTSMQPAGRIRLSFTALGTENQQDFTILPNMGPPVLLGIQAIAALRMNLKPPYNIATWPTACLSEPCQQMGLRVPDEGARRQFDDFLQAEMKLFEAVPGRTNLIEHRIKLLDETPLKQRYQPRNPAMQAIINEEVAKMLNDRVIEPSSSPWSSPVVVVKKKDGKPRFCVDFRRLNDRSEKDAYPLPHIQATLEKLRGARYLTTLDLKNGYWQVPLEDASRPPTAFTVPGKGLFQFRVMPFGLHSAPATFQRLFDRIIGPELEPYAFAYLDDIIIASKTLEEHQRHLREVFRRLRAAGLRLNPDKCRFCVSSLRYLGHIVDQQGIRTDPEKTSAIAKITAPKNIREVRRFHVMASWYRRFVPNFAEIVEPLTQLTRKNAKWKWTEAEEKAFQTLKDKLVTTPVLACPDFEQPFTLQTDASDHGLGVVLIQGPANKERVIAYASHTLSTTERNYSATEKECLAVVWGIRKMKPYLEGYHFTVLTDHQALRWLQQIDSPTGRLARWALELQQYDFDIQYRPGKLNHVADALSRIEPVPGVSLLRTKPRNDSWYEKKMEAVQHDPASVPNSRIYEGKLQRRIPHQLDYNEPDSGNAWRICIPATDREAVLRQFHDDPTAGHLGIAKTSVRIAQRYHWPGMFRDIARHVRSCVSCQQYKSPPVPPPGRLHANPGTQPWHTVSVDLVGPLPRTHLATRRTRSLFEVGRTHVPSKSHQHCCRRGDPEGYYPTSRSATDHYIRQRTPIHWRDVYQSTTGSRHHAPPYTSVCTTVQPGRESKQSRENNASSVRREKP
ncbi:uncharacterized protein LOC143218325 [Lasioglossum baleicum]|uniref:uncharacterized protein LOC143218325 n=1 Tax=Lasioglossum baleicum TaxID=434251 RepID=UPI003FCDFE9F